MVRKKYFILLMIVCLIHSYNVFALNVQGASAEYPVASSLHLPTVKNMLANACLPIGKALYVYGGAWNEEDTGAGAEAISYGISPRWEMFYKEQKPTYDYKTTRYQIHNGLDCTGYIGWTMYQIFGNTYSNTGYVYVSRDMALSYSRLFGGIYTEKENVTRRQCGDIMSSNGHAYIVVGQCRDGSVVLLHASPPAVTFCGTYTPSGNVNSEAVNLATYYMKTYFPEHYQKYSYVSRNEKYLKDYNRMEWTNEVLRDPDGYRNMWAEDILEDLFESVKIYTNGDRLVSDADPYILDGTTYVPLRAVSENFGANVIWEEDTKNARINAGGRSIIIDIADETVKLDGVLDNRTFRIVNDRITVPIRLVADLCGFSVEWESVSKSVYLNNCLR